MGEMGQETVLATVEKFRSALESVDIRVDRVILFDPQAEGNAHEDSDSDPVVISSSFTNKKCIFPDPLIKPSGTFSGNLHQFADHIVAGFRE
jgi:hypothetical protein